MRVESKSEGRNKDKGWGSYLNQKTKSEAAFGVDHASSACDKSPCLTGTSFSRPPGTCRPDDAIVASLAEPLQ